MSSSPAAPFKGKNLSFSPGYNAVRDQHMELRLNDVLTERYCLALTAESDPFNTACWSYDSDAKTHIITFGQKITENLKDGAEASLPEYAKSYYRHEVAHSLWTVRDLDSINSKLKAAGANFSLFNLLEDARIESRWRKSFGGTFNWLDFEAPLFPPERLATARPAPGEAATAQWAMDVLTTIIQNEGDHSIRAPGAILGDLPEADPIWDFYGQLCSVPDRNEARMVSMVQQWITQFGVPPEVPNGSSRAGGSDMSTAASVQADPGLASALSERARGEQAAGHGSKGYKSSSGRRGGVLMTTPAHAVSSKRADTLEKLIAEAFRFGEIRTKEESPSRRISIRDAIFNRPECFIHKRKERERSARVFLLFDTSGSMSGAPSDSGRHLALALSNLARKGRIEGHIAFTQCRKSVAYHEILPLQNFTEDHARRLPADGDAEGIANAIRKCSNEIQQADIFICYTDGNITDAQITDAERSIWHSRGVYTFGVYVGDAERAEPLKGHFDYALCRSTERNLAVALATMIRRYSATRQRKRGQSVSTAKRIALVDTPEASEDQTPKVSI